MRYVRQFVAPVVASLLMAVAMMLVREALPSLMSLSARFATLVAFGAIVYVTALRLFGPSVFNEVLDFAKSALPGRRKRTAVGLTQS